LKRRKLPRPERAHSFVVVIAILFIIVAFIGNVKMNSHSFYTFIDYLIPTVIFIVLMLNRSFLVKLLIMILAYFYKNLRKIVVVSNRKLQRLQIKINSQEFVFFTKGNNVEIINKVMQYVQNNETTKKN